jgi:phosphotransferase system  glucose/maltose/N-acetylglucosamine-specific IIC component
MSERLKILGIFAVLGFIAGILANVAYDVVVPAILAALPNISGKWVVSGFTGMILTLLVLAVWAYFSQKPRKME